MLISNPRAGSVSQRRRDVIAKALSADFKLDVVDTARRDHAQELSRGAASDGFDAVIAFGGDGTVNEVAQGVACTDVAFGILPGGTTNVMARSLGIPDDPVEATSFLASRMRIGQTKRINLGQLGERYFLFSCGIGLDAEVVRRVEADPRRYGPGREWRFLKHALVAGATSYRSTIPKMKLTVGDEEPFETLFSICCNSRPLTFFKKLPMDVCPQAHLDEGLDFFALSKVRFPTIPRIIWSTYVSRSHPRWRNGRYFHDASSATFEAYEPLPVQVDGDYIGQHPRGDVALVRDALSLVF